MCKLFRKYFKWLLPVFFIVFLVVGDLEQCRVFASENVTSEDGEKPDYNVSGSIVQVVLLYQDEDMNSHIIQSGSGILLDENTVITNRQLIVLSDANKAAAGAYLSEKLEKTISFVPAEDGSGEVATYQIAVVIEADIYDMATCSFSSKDWDVATLKLQSPMSKECAVLGDSDQVQAGTRVSVLGFPDSPCTAPRSFQLGDIMITEGVCSDCTSGMINHTAVMQQGNTGGALVDEYGRVIGITTYTGTEEGIYSALPINQVKAYLDRDGVAYKEDRVDYSAVEQVPTQTDADNENSHTTTKTDLYRTIQEAKIICEEGNDGLYTEESFRALQVEYDVAKKVYDDKNAEQKTIDEEPERLQEVIDGLVKIKKVNVTLIVIIIVSSVVGVALITVLIILLVKKKKKDKKAKEEKEKIKVIDGNKKDASSEYAATSQKNYSAISNEQNLGLPSSQLYMQFDAKANANKEAMNNAMNNAMYANEGTTVLQSGDGTTVLQSIVPEPAHAFLYRESTGETIAITGEAFTIGKSNEQADYWISDNTNISRTHARVLRLYGQYYIEDLNSTNYTYVNGIRIEPGIKQILEVNDVIYLANEKFVFMTNN